MMAWRISVLVLIAVVAVTGAGCGKKKRVNASVPRLPTIPRPVGYTETGYASWYGHPYHGRATSSGETYDMRQMTAAHRTLPFGTQVEVKNLENGERTRVRINDRGPFIAGRIIDLSLSAAEEIRLVLPGTALVQVKVLRVNGASPRPAAIGSAAHSGRFTVQVGTFADRRNAERLRDQLARRYPQFPVNTAITPDGQRHRVWVGNESDEPSANAIADRLRAEQITAFVVRLD